jgi:transposase
MDTTTPSLASIGIDIGKEVFHIVGLGTDGKIAFRRKIKRLTLIEAFKKLPPSVVGMEACLSAHFVSRALRQLGHEPRIIPAIYVKPFVKGQKNDYNDAEAIAEATLRPNLRTVREKTQDQLDLQACHRVRSRLVSRRTATINQIRAFLIEQGIAVRTGATALRNSLPAILKNRQDEISPRMRGLIAGLYEDWICLDERIETIAGEIEKIGEKEAFERGRDFGAWLGLVPRQYSTGGRSTLGRISKRGSKYLRTLFIQAANVILMRPHNWERFSFGTWLLNAAPRLHRNKLATALANKLARIAWSILRNEKTFDVPRHEVMAI